jgi:hypothetical protein
VTAHHESWVDKQIREAQERGEFDGLASAGKPLDRFDQPVQPDWWVQGLIARENLDASLLLPPQIALRREAERLPATVLGARTETAARALVEDFNARVREFWRRPVEGPMLPVRTVDVDALLVSWRQHSARQVVRRARMPEAAPRAATPRAARGWWRRLRRSRS